MKLALIGATTLALLVSGCASTDKSLDTAGGQRIVNEAGEVTHICHTQRSTSSRIGQRTCRSVEQDSEARAQAQEEARRMQRSGTTGPTN